MAFEIERKFLVNEMLWNKLIKPEGEQIVQAYLSLDPEKTVRIRVKGNQGFITIKGITQGITRIEHEYPIPKIEVLTMIEQFNLDAIHKIRYSIKHKNKLWEIDEFFDSNLGLLVAEVELNSEDESIELPEWVQMEVSDDKRYFNSNLMTKPFSLWNK